MYVKVTDGNAEIYTIGKLRKDNPNTSFPRKIPDATLAAYGVYPVIEANPTADSDQKIVKSWTPELIEGVWTLNHQAVDMTADEIAERDSVIAANVREKRDGLLAETDWTGLSDVTMSAEMTTYRQALRDITNHDNFPNLEEADWPTKP